MAEIKMTTEITLDTEGGCLRYALAAKQGDKGTRFVKVKIIHNGEIVTIPESATAIVNIRKPDKNVCYNACTIEDNNVVFELTNQALASAGAAVCDIELREDDTKVLSTQSFEIFIEKSERDDKAIESSDELTALEKRMQNITDAAKKETKNAMNAAENAKNAAKAATQAAEKSENAAKLAGEKAKTADEAANRVLQLVNHITFSINADDGGLDITYTP